MGQLATAGQALIGLVSQALFLTGAVRLTALEANSFRRRKDTMKNIITKVQKFMKSEDGPTAVEYAIMLALIVIVCLTAIQAVGSAANSAFEDVTTQLTGAGIGN